MITCDHTEVVTTPGKEATCTEDGITEGIHCSVCPEIIKPQGYVKALDHEEGDWIVKTEPTIDAEGYRYKECTRCYEKIAEENIPYLGTNGLTYEVNADQTSCTVTGMGEFDGDVMIIPAKIDGYKVTAIGEWAFILRESIKKVIIPYGVTKTGIFAFNSCRGLESIEIPASISYIGYKAFQGCLALKSFAIPDGIEAIYDDGFSGSDIEKFYISKNVTTIQGHAISGSDDLTIYYEGSEADWLKIDISNTNPGLDSATYVYNYTEE